MQNVLPINSCNDEDQFARINSFSLSETEQSTLIRLAIEVLELRHR
ncbi:MAG: DNA repair protein RadC, partial [Gammaproteobacteria bacterium]|nr:DNA repair protein RadC [Gammaproteobacteria bacterium]